MKRAKLVFTLGMAACCGLQAQLGAPGSGSSSGTRAISLPASGRTQSGGSVQATQSAAAGSGTAAINSSVQVSGDLNGSVPDARIPDGPVTLTLSEALARGLRTNLGAVSADNSMRAARGQRLQQLSALLPAISASLSETVAQTNLAAYGFQFSAPAGSDITIPTVVGPYSYSQAQGQLSQSVFDLVKWRNWKASKETERASVQNAKDTREMVVLAVGGSYLQVIAAVARVDSQRAQVESARAVYDQATVRKQAGINAKIDVMRSLTELQTQQQRLSSIESDLEKQKISFARIVGVPLDHALVLSEKLKVSSSMLPELQGQIRRALNARAGLEAARAQVKAAQLVLSAARAERYPSASVDGNYGVIGRNPAATHGVFTANAAVRIPVWQSGRVKGEIMQAESTLRQRQAELDDERGKVEAEVRTAWIELRTAMGQVKVAETNQTYAQETLNEARDRFAAGIANTVEVVQAQEQVANAENDYISSLFSFNLAKLSLARSTGSAEAALPNLLDGKQP